MLAEALGLNELLHQEVDDDSSIEESQTSRRRRCGGIWSFTRCDSRQPIPKSLLGKVSWYLRRALCIGGSVALKFIYHMLMFLACLWVYKKYKSHFATLASMLG